MTEPDLLAGIRVLDFAAEPLAYTGRIFVELGADVVLVEPPGGAPLRRSAPLVTTASGDTLSATFMAYAAGKRSVVIDRESSDDRSLLERLLATADVVLSPTEPFEGSDGTLDEVGLRSLDPSLVVVSATAFGLTGPRSSWRGSDATAWASSGMNHLMGDADRPPVVAPVGLSNALTSLNAAMGSLLALRSRRRTGRGQLVDISMQEAVLSASMEAGPQLALEGRPLGRVPRVRLPGVGIYDPPDGAAVDVNAFLPGQWDALADWIATDLGIEEARLEVFKGGIVSRMPYTELITTWILELAGRYSKQEFFLEAQRRGIPCGPLNEAGDLTADQQLAEVGAWDDHPATNAPDFRLPRGPLTVDGEHAVAGAVPSVGEHGAEILDPLR